MWDSVTELNILLSCKSKLAPHNNYTLHIVYPIQLYLFSTCKNFKLEAIWIIVEIAKCYRSYSWSYMFRPW